MPADTTKKQLGRRGGVTNQLNLSTLHSAKGTKYYAIIILGLDQGELPSLNWANRTPERMEAARRLLSVGITRARDEVHLFYSGFRQDRQNRRYEEGPSEFLKGLLS